MLLLAPPLPAQVRKPGGVGRKSHQHSVTFGHATPTKLFVGPNEQQSIELNIRPLYVDGNLKEFTSGDTHDVTDRTFVVRRVFRINDVLPDDPKAAPHWKWQRDGWLLVNRSTGRVSPVTLPEFDPYYSAASWYRDYVAYCGISSNGEKLYAMVMQIGQRRPLAKHALGAAPGGDAPDSACPAPEWQRTPVRVTFQPQGGQKLAFELHGSAAELVNPEETKN